MLQVNGEEKPECPLGWGAKPEIKECKREGRQPEQEATAFGKKRGVREGEKKKFSHPLGGNG